MSLHHYTHRRRPMAERSTALHIMRHRTRTFISRTSSHDATSRCPARPNAMGRARNAAVTIGLPSMSRNSFSIVAAARPAATSLILCAGSTTSDLSKPARHWRGRRRTARIARPPNRGGYAWRFIPITMKTAEAAGSRQGRRMDQQRRWRSHRTLSAARTRRSDRRRLFRCRRRRRSKS